jgi:SAM-dependent methyltransferase
MNNRHNNTIEGFGDEWRRFDQSDLSESELRDIFETYFGIFPWNLLDDHSIGFDMGCGSGRWAKLVAPRVGKLYCVDPSQAIEVAKKNLSKNNNCIFLKEEVGNNSIPENSMDFGYSLGVLHHIPDTQDGIKSCVKKLKKGAPFLVYLYYKFDNKSTLFKLIWRCSDFLRKLVSKSPYPIRYFLSQVIAVFIYFPLARLCLLLANFGIKPKSIDSIPLSWYRDKSFSTMRTDALDRFGTQLERRFTRSEILNMLSLAGLQDIHFSETRPYWVAVGIKGN